MLLEHGAEAADINARDTNRWTPFVLASRRGLAEVMHVPIKHGANWYPRRRGLNFILRYTPYSTGADTVAV